MKKRRRILYGINRSNFRLLEGAQRFAREHNWDLYIDMSLTSSIPLRWQGDGIISWLMPGNPLTEYILSRPEPMVIVEHQMPQIAGPRVVHDNVAAGKMAAEHFLEKGFSDFAFFYMRDMYFNRDQIAGFSAELQKAGHNPFICGPGASKRNPAQWLASQLRRLPHPLAVFAAEDVLAGDIVHITQESGLRVPDDIAVLGTPDIREITEHAPVPISSIVMDEEGLTYRACQLLDRILDGERKPLPCTLVPPRGISTRASTATTAFGNTTVQETMAFINAHYREPIGVQQIAAHLGLDRRRLSMIFKGVTGITPHNALSSRRIERVKELLTSTDWSLPRIAAATGFTTHQYLCRFFRKASGCSPTDFRRRHR